MALIRVNQYEFDPAVDILGTGGMARIYKSHDLSLDRYVVLKQLTSDGTLQGDKKADHFFERESRIMAKLSHQGLPVIYEVIDQGRYIVQELVEGKNLEEILTHGSFPEETAVQIMIEVCDAVNYLHSENVYHNDLNTRNIMIQNNGKVKLVDFGIANGEYQAERTRILMSSGLGTPPFCSPEQYSSNFAPNPQSEVYMLGVTLYSLLSNNPFPEAVDRILKNEQIRDLKKNKQLEFKD